MILNLKVKFLLPILLLIILCLVDIKSQIDNHSTETASLSDEELNIEKTVDLNVFDSIKAYRLRSETELRFLTEISDMTFLLFYYKATSAQSKKIAGYLKNIVDKIQDLATVVMIDCDNFMPDSHFNCRDFTYVQDSFPRLKLLIPPEKRYDSLTKEIEVHFEYPWTESEMTEQNIYTYITDNIPVRATKVNKENLYSFLNNDLFNKVILFTDKAHSSLLWRGLTNNFFERMLFGVVFKSEGDIIQQFNITKFPTLVLYKVNDFKRLLDEPEIIKYEGFNKIENLLEWIEPHALKEKRYITQKRGVQDTSAKIMAKDIELRTINSTNYEDYLTKFENKNVIFYFNTKNNPKISIKQNLIHNNGFFISAFFDCDSDRKFCLEKFNVTKFPMLKFIPKINENNNILKLEERINNHHTFNTSNKFSITFEDQIRELFPTKVKEMTNMEFPFELNQIKMENKNFILHLYDDEETNKKPIALDLLSNDEYVNKRFAFISLKNPSSDILRLNNIPWKSGLFIFQKIAGDDYKVIPVCRDSLYSSLYTIVDNLIYLIANYKGRVDFTSEVVKQITTSAHLRKDCLDSEHCVLAFFDARPTQENVNKFNTMIEKLEKVKASSSRFNFLRFNWVNATCHKYLADKFEINMEDLPGLTFYYRSRDTYSTFVGLWESFTLTEYFERCFSDRYPSKTIGRNEVFLKNTVCEQVYNDTIIDEDVSQEIGGVNLNANNLEESVEIATDVEKNDVVSKEDKIEL